MKQFLVILSLFLTWNLNASHIVGGEITYKYISKAANGNTTYRIRLELYLDCKDGNPESIAADATALINVFDAKTGTLNKSLCKEVARQTPARVTINTYKCITNVPSVCVDLYLYEVDIVLPKNNNGYIITFERCCRNDIIANLNNPGTTGATYWTEIQPESVIGKNNSPVFKSKAPIFLCLNAPFTFDHSATDADGDSLVYELFTPYKGGSTTRNRPNYNQGGAGAPAFPIGNNKLVTWGAGYSLANMMGGNPILEIDEITGRMTITPTQVGQFVIGFKVKEYRNGVLIGETKRDYQFNVANCIFNILSNFTPSANISANSKVFCSNTPVQFNNQSYGATSFRWDFGVPNIASDTSVLKSPTYTYKDAGTYKVILIAKNSSCIDTFDYIITVKQDFKVKLGRDTIFCNPTTFKLDAGYPGYQYLWSTGENTRTINVSNTGKYAVTVTNSPCQAKDTILVIIDKSTFNAGKDSTQCNDAFIPFTSEPIPNASNYNKITWNDNTNLSSVYIPKPGKYWVTVINTNNCLRSDTLEVFHFIPPKNYLRDTIVCLGYLAQFDAKNPGYQYNWSTGENTQTITTSKAGMYIVSIYDGLCKSSDTAYLSNYQPGLEIGRDTSFCGPFSYSIQTNKPFEFYSWNNETHSRKATFTAAGMVKVTIQTKEGCFQSDSLTLTNYPQNISSITGDTTACTSSILDLVASSNLSYAWNTGEYSQGIKIQESGVYSVIVSDSNNCYDTVYHKVVKNPDAFPNDVYMANAFTPNGDKLNDVYPDSKFHDIKAYYNLKIFNRWGEKLFETDSPSANWDGNYLGKSCQSDVYIYSLNYKGCDNNRHSLKGEFHLIR